MNIFYAAEFRDEARKNLLLLSVRSLVRFATEKNPFSIHIVYAGEDFEFIEKLKSLSVEHATITIESPNPLFYRVCEVTQRHTFPPMVLYRFFAPYVFPTEEKVLYSDFDILYDKDPTPFYENLPDGFIASGVKDIGQHLFRNKNDPVSLIRRNSDYVNSGFIVLNLDQMRQEDASYRLFEETEKVSGSLADQDGFNSLFHGRLFCADLRNNLLVSHLDKYTPAVLSGIYSITDKTVNDLIEEASVFHFCGKSKQYLLGNEKHSNPVMQQKIDEFRSLL